MPSDQRLAAAHGLKTALRAGAVFCSVDMNLVTPFFQGQADPQVFYQVPMGIATENSNLCFNWKPDRHQTSSALGISNVQGSLMAGDDLLTHGQTDAGASGLELPL